LAGGLWELFEFTADTWHVATVAVKPLGMIFVGWRESFEDLLFGAIGALAAAGLLIFLFIWNKQ